MSDVSKFMIDGTTYNVKDTTARGSISTITQKNTEQDGKITELESDVGTLQSTVSEHTSSISSMEGDIAELQGNQAHKPTYSNETITLSPAE